MAPKQRNVLLILVFVLMIVAGIKLYPMFFKSEDISINQNGRPVGTQNPLLATATPADQKEIVAHICGAVKKAGVYTLPGNSRVKDFIDAAGGATKDANLDLINLARVVKDGEQIMVPRLSPSGDFPTLSPPVPTPTEIEMTEVPEDSNTVDSDKIETETTGPVNINKATVGDLMDLPGIGLTIAQRIISYRKTNNGFKDIEELKKVEGVGEKTFEKLKDRVIVN
jgi:competence protein ComEA